MTRNSFYTKANVTLVLCIYNDGLSFLMCSALSATHFINLITKSMKQWQQSFFIRVNINVYKQQIREINIWNRKVWEREREREREFGMEKSRYKNRIIGSSYLLIHFCWQLLNLCEFIGNEIYLSWRSHI